MYPGLTGTGVEEWSLKPGVGTYRLERGGDML